MKRYDLVPDGPDAVAPVECRDGEWVRFHDLIQLVASAGLLAIERDKLERDAREYREALAQIAGVPLTIPSAALAVDRAREVLDGAS